MAVRDPSGCRGESAEYRLAFRSRMRPRSEILRNQLGLETGTSVDSCGIGPLRT